MSIASSKIEIFQNGQLLQEMPLEGEMWVGRDEQCSVRLDDRAISRKHALFRTTDQGIEFENKSKFGWVKINGTEQSQAMLKAGDRVELGPFEIRVSGVSVEVAVTAESEIVVAPEMTVPVIEESDSEEVSSEESALETAEELQVSIESELPADVVQLNTGSESEQFGMGAAAEESFSEVNADGATKVFSAQDLVKPILSFTTGNTYEITDQEISIGRSQQCHVVLEDKRSSRKHLTIRKEDKKYIIKDLGSANGTLVNDNRLEGEIELGSGDRIQVGETVFTFQLVQADYEMKKEQFLNVPPEQLSEVASPLDSMHGSISSGVMFDQAPQPVSAFQQQFDQPQIQNSTGFETPVEEKKSMIGKLLDRYRAMSTKQQIIYGIVVLGAIWMMLQDDPTDDQVKLTTASVKAKQAKKAASADKEKKQGGLPTFDTLTKEQQHYIETQYQLGFDLYKNREYDKAIFEIEKIFRIVQDYKQSREIHSYAIEGKRQLEVREEDRKKKEAERQNQLKLQSMVEEASLLIEKKKFKEAEALFPEIELLQPEHAAVGEWRKLIASETDRVEKEKAEKARTEAILKTNQADFQKALELKKKKQYYDLIDELEDMLDRSNLDPKLKKNIEAEVEASYKTIADERDPILEKAKKLEEAGNLTEAYRTYQEALKVDAESEIAPKGMQRIRGTLTARAKSVYTEGVFAESFNDFETAEKKFNEVLEIVPEDDDYYLKAQSRIKRLSVFKKPAEKESTP